MELSFSTILFALAAVAIPIFIIFFTLRFFRKQKEDPSERGNSLGEKFKDVKEERMEKQYGSKKV